MKHFPQGQPQELYTPVHLGTEVGRELIEEEEKFFDPKEWVTPEMYETFKDGICGMTLEVRLFYGNFFQMFDSKKREEIGRLIFEDIYSEDFDNASSDFYRNLCPFLSFVPKELLYRVDKIRDLYRENAIEELHNLSQWPDTVFSHGYDLIFFDPSHRKQYQDLLNENDLRTKLINGTVREMYTVLYSILNDDRSIIDKMTQKEKEEYVHLVQIKQQKKETMYQLPAPDYFSAVMCCAVVFAQRAYIDDKGQIVIVPKKKKVVATKNPLPKTIE